MRSFKEIVARLADIAEEPTSYIEAWKQSRGRKVIGIFPMNFPAELVHATGSLPVIVQEKREPITLGRKLLFEFYCSYTRSLADQAAKQQLGVFDAFFIVDHCVALLGAVDAMRFELTDQPIYLAQYTASMDEPWTPPEIMKQLTDLKIQLEELCGSAITQEALSNSIRLYNRNRQQLRRIYDLRRSGKIRITASDIQAIIKSGMVMDIEEHTSALTDLISALESQKTDVAPLARLHLSGHFCHAPPPELLDMIEDCGAVVVDDDLFTGFRFISTDVSEAGSPIEALMQWYFDRNNNVPCSTRAQTTVDWESYLVNSLEKSGAQGVIILMVKFCEPHMLYYPELRKELERREIPHLVIETEHEGLPIELFRTRVEALLERVRRSPTIFSAAS